MDEHQHEGEHDSRSGGSEPELASRQQRPPLPAPLKPARIRASFGIRPAPLIWSHVLIPAVSVGAPLLVGAALDEPSVGLIAALGGFTGQYALHTPYRRRAVTLAWVGAGFVATIALATLSAPTVVGASLGLGAIALVATFLCGALNIGAPAGFMFVLVGAIGVGLPADVGEVWTRAGLAAAGAGCAWLVSMTGWLVRGRGPEEAVLAAAYERVADFLAAIGTPRLDSARHQAGAALRTSRMTLFAGLTDGTATPALGRLLLLGRQANDLFLAGVALAQEASGLLQPELPSTVRALVDAIDDPSRAGALSAPGPGTETPATLRVRDSLAAAIAIAASAGSGTVNVGAMPRPASLFQELRAATRRESLVLPTSARVGVVVGVAMFVAGVAHLDHASWVPLTSAAVQGTNVVVTFQRTVQRTAGTVVGVAVGAALLVVDPVLAVVALFVMVLQMGFRVVVERNFALGTLFLTPIALLLAEVGQPGAVTDLAGARLLDTVLGAAVSIAGSLSLWPRVSSVRVPAALGHAIECEGTLVEVVLSGRSAEDVSAWRRSRSSVRTALDNLNFVYDSATGDPPPPGSTVELRWPAVIAADRLGYLAESLPRDVGPTGLTSHDLTLLRVCFDQLAASARHSSLPAPVELPEIDAENAIVTELRALREALIAAATGRAVRAGTDR